MKPSCFIANIKPISGNQKMDTFEPLVKDIDA